MIGLLGRPRCWNPEETQEAIDSLVDAETNIYTKREGEDITVRCNLTFSGSRKLLCKETCEEGNILINTTSNEDQRGRYSIKYEYRYIQSSILDVTITKLTKSDSGWYRCELQKDWSPDSEDNFKIIVTEGEFDPQNHENIYL
uniref:Immunoglobulin domain-containing protein n=1 Tax=Oryzias latipes TaxID=8090 RepID=A0A3P9IIP7_ORYLA